MTSIPFVTAIPFVVVNPQTQQPVLINGHPVPLIGPDGPLGPGDHVLLTASSLMAQGFGLPPGIPGSNGQPLPDGVVLNASETAAVTARVAAYNNVIRTVAAEKGAAVADVNAAFNDVVAHGIDIGGLEVTNAFLTGGLFSYDGVHPTALGYAVLANTFIDAINDSYGASIPHIAYTPFLFGNAGQVAGGCVIPAGAAAWTFSQKAGEQLRNALRVPSDEELDRAAAGPPDPAATEQPQAPRRQAPQALSRAARRDTTAGGGGPSLFVSSPASAVEREPPSAGLLRSPCALGRLTPLLPSSVPWSRSTFAAPASTISRTSTSPCRATAWW